MGPPVLAFALSLYAVAGWAGGASPFWSSPEVNVSEAAMIRDHAEVVRLIRAGQDPNRSWPISAEASDDGREQTATPLEAAIRIRRLELVELLIREGARVPPDVRPRLVALAQQVDAPDIVEYMNRLETAP